jgi:secreted trypsin-like serine protease
MLKRLPLLAAALAALALPAPASAIVNGTAPTRDYPFLAALEENGGQICGSSLIAPQWILTAAHCVDDAKASDLTFQIGGVKYVGSPSDLWRQNNLGERIAATQVIVHADYDPSTMRNDVALVKLARNSVYPPIPVADPATQKPLWAPGKEATVVGYGGPSYQAPNVRGDLKEARIPMVADKECGRTYNDLSFGFTGEFDAGTMVCAGNLQGTEDSCQGDSGGPLVVQKADGSLVQAGVVSWGFACGLPAFYGVYARIGDNPLNGWIKARVTGMPTP